LRRLLIYLLSGKKSDFRQFHEESSGLKVQPKNVLIISLVYMGIVVMLHILSKLGTVKQVV